MKIECFFSEGCGSREELKENLRQALREEGTEAGVSFQYFPRMGPNKY